ncbi:MAG: o-succinylbenzoate synthase [Planctomycetes bacterium]|nr:o-succinylbenzoate synthase [Planctomycetota bacterium]
MQSFSVAWYELPIRAPFPAGGEMVRTRRGAILRMEDGDRTGYGELAPLAGLHRESLQDALEGLLEATQSGSMPMAPSASFALSCAHATWVHDRRYGFGRIEHSAIGVNAVFSGDAVAARAAIERGEFDGYRTVKVKVGRGKVADDAALIGVMLEGLDPSVRLRLDGNRRLTMTAAVRLMKRLDAERIEYMEEPLRNPLDMPELSRRTGIAMAIDESLHEPAHREALVGAPGIEVQVLKPSLLGALEEVEHAVTRGRIHGMDTVLSSCLESSYTLALLARLASVTSTGGRDHGLASAGLFEFDLVEQAPVREGRMEIAPALPIPRLDFVPLKEAAVPWR